ncbi:MAG: hypothetical protein H3Z52_13535 [archaeon]|nr:hypothetical protein [archaeon]MCP8321936.1 hypothetical protein [archaeon]
MNELDDRDKAILEAVEKHKDKGIWLTRLSEEVKDKVSWVTLRERVDKLEKEGYITIEDDPHHRQRKIIRPAGIISKIEWLKETLRKSKEFYIKYMLEMADRIEDLEDFSQAIDSIFSLYMEQLGLTLVYATLEYGVKVTSNVLLPEATISLMELLDNMDKSFLKHKDTKRFIEWVAELEKNTEARKAFFNQLSKTIRIDKADLSRIFSTKTVEERTKALQEFNKKYFSVKQDV